ncbi:phytanoyl-CoA dioxygenase domain-containing protein 1-like [Acanthaster planci]|uniref:Phytanoyl-CoA dioxygenase domain-containing protein 1-like n=1 Tax=Acanthaster planci TaxID=133434 RepID=A0A8B7XVX0_ACAPL|nr:phytanoyl-CoA dioxygenase domain-containing protein 1-like [Acanthaster planci]
MATEDDIAKFHKDGYVVIKDFLTPEEVDSLKRSCCDIVTDMNPKDHTMTVFDCRNQTRDDYFLTSGDKIRFFFEKGAVSDNGELTIDKHLSLNKIGHALHELVLEFKKVTHNPNVQDVARKLGYIKPVIVQSMYIFKQPKFGGEVPPHMDASFLCNEPLKLTGFWIALEKCTLENACLQFIPGSQGMEVKTRMIRNPDGDEPSLIFTGDRNLDMDPNLFVPEEVEPGTCILIHGQVIHKSEENRSDRSRHIYTFHIAESLDSKWHEGNWLQPSKEMPFPELYTSS